MAENLNKPILRQNAIREIYACGQNPVYFINNYCKIRHVTKGLIPLSLYQYQQKAIKSFLAYDRVIVNKPRQMGFSTIVAAFIAWMILFHNDQVILIVSNKKESAKGLLAKVKLILNHLPHWMYLCDILENNVHSIALSNGSSVKSIATSNDAGRSEAVSLLVLDEAAHIRNIDELWQAASYTVSTGGKVIALSTPKGCAGFFYKTFTEAQAGENNWFPFLCNWWDNPEYAEGLKQDPTSPGGYTSPWFEDMTVGKSRQQIAEELLTSFVETGDSFFSGETIQYLHSVSCEPIEKRGIDKTYWIWKKPIQSRRYLVAADCALGSGEDFSTCHVIELSDLEVVAEFKGKLPPDVFATLLVEIAQEYNDAYICPENQTIGQVVGYLIKEFGYKNLCYLDDTGRMVDRWYAEQHNIHPGQRMTPKERIPMLGKLEEFLRKKYVKVYSKRLANEIQTFVTLNGKPQAAKDCNDDLIMALAIGIWVRDTVPEFRGTNNAVDYLKLIEGIKKDSQPFIQSHPREFAITQQKQNIQKIIEAQMVPIKHPNNQAFLGIYKVR